MQSPFTPVMPPEPRVTPHTTLSATKELALTPHPPVLQQQFPMLPRCALQGVLAPAAAKAAWVAALPLIQPPSHSNVS